MYSPAGIEAEQQNSSLEHNNKPVGPEDGLYVRESYSPYRGEETSSSGARKVSPPARRICGLSRKTFWILLVATIVIFAAAALGGGLGGGLSKKNSATASPQQTSDVSVASTGTANIGTNTASGISTGVASPTTDVVVTVETGTFNGSQLTLTRDCPSTNNTLYSVALSSTTYKFRKLCGLKFTNSEPQNPNWVNQQASSLNDCISLCAEWNENDVTKNNPEGVCSAVCWRYSFEKKDDLPGYCFGFTTANATSGSFSTLQDSTCDSAVWINQS